MSNQDVWADRLAAAIAHQVRRHRQAKRMSTQDLADETERLGHPIARAVLANFENGRRPTIKVAEWFVLAAALGVPPLALIFPWGDVDVVEPLPGVEMPPLDALWWVQNGVRK